MKQLWSFSLIVLLCISGCKKSDVDPIDPIENTVIGKWTYTDSRIGTGGFGQWQPVTPPGETIEFRSNGSFISSGSFLTANKFTILDSVTIKFEPATTPSGYLLMGYSIDTVARELVMFNVEPMCIEGCAYKFKR